MQINIYNPADSVEDIEGFTIVVDVFRAFSTAYYINQNNPAKYIISESIEHSFELKEKVSNPVLIGERQGIKIDGFDFGNSPSDIHGHDFSNNIIIHTTTAGTKGLLAQPDQNEVVVGSFVNAGAMENYIRKQKIEKVNIYCTAPEGNLYGEEDYIFAEYFKRRLLGKPGDFESIVKRLRKGSGQYFVREDFAPYTDFLFCLDIDRFDCLLKRKLVNTAAYSIELELLI